ncbi:DUF3995 domain-containing protein [Leptospira sp. GIMC2001]|uniref:DUF3995 domain-containing protein n=1 Tax=Leptospira sp. GIMC2001 TaxID=1513297 RepID=UPI00234A8792|nr:DUF3995 domain-containing protein [Leptospira sp. GIMC2001]WCL49663.1 DUF3995 domain-containing protein [Leptospira sp. GIMC2001]
MIFLSQWILVLIFFSLGLLHFFWAMGYKWGFEKALPRKENGSFLFYPKRKESLAIGIFLSLFALFYLLQTGIGFYTLSERIFSIGSWIIIAVFGLRSIGEFKYVGFTKRIRNSEFSKLDTMFYSPLCLLITALAFFVL